MFWVNACSDMGTVIRFDSTRQTHEYVRAILKYNGIDDGGIGGNLIDGLDSGLIGFHTIVFEVILKFGSFESFHGVSCLVEEFVLLAAIFQLIRPF